jgi:signal transduction histidine kinase
MEMVVWVLVVGLAVALIVLLFRKSDNPYAGALDRLSRDLERGGELNAQATDDPPEVGRIRAALASGWQPVREEVEEDSDDRAIRGLVRFLDAAAVGPLKQSLESEDSREIVASVVNALEDLRFYAQDPPPSEPRHANVPELIQKVVREYIQETDIPVKVRYSQSTLRTELDPEAFSDGLFLLLANAGRFGEGNTVVVEAEGAGEGIRVRVLDRGPGFESAALEHAFEPFWSTDPDAVGMGLPFARRLLEARGMRLRVGNREGGGGEAVIFIPTP